MCCVALTFNLCCIIYFRSFYKHALGMTVDYSDIEAVEPDYYKSLKQILELPLDMLGLDLTFSADSHTFGRLEVQKNTLIYIHFTILQYSRIQCNTIQYNTRQ